MKNAAIALSVFLLLGTATGAKAGDDIEALIRDASIDRQHIPALMRRLVTQPVYVIAQLNGPRATAMRIQDFIRDGRSFIPVFSDEAHFRVETRGSGFEQHGVALDGNLLAAILRGDELLVLNPGSSTPVDLDAKDLKSFIDHERLPNGGI